MAQNPSRDPNPGWPAAAIVALRRHWLEGLTTAEIASRLGKTARAVECKIYKLRSRGWDLPARRRRDFIGWHEDQFIGIGIVPGAGAPRVARLDQRGRRALQGVGDFLDGVVARMA